RRPPPRVRRFPYTTLFRSMKTFQQMDWIAFVMLPMFMFSATFYPISVYPQGIQWVIEALPLWHGVELVRGLTTGVIDVGMAWHVDRKSTRLNSSHVKISYA